jgi:excisionase family DNA binding protein
MASLSPGGDQLLTRAEAGDMLACGMHTVDWLIRWGQITAYTVGIRSVRVSRQSIVDYLASRQIGGAA